MNIAEIIEQARVLSLQERRELIDLLNETITQETHMPAPHMTTRDLVRAKLVAAGRLSQTHTTASQERLPDPPPFVLPAGARSSDSIRDEDCAER